MLHCVFGSVSWREDGLDALQAVARRSRSSDSSFNARMQSGVLLVLRHLDAVEVHAVMGSSWAHLCRRDRYRLASAGLG